jgi:hypothetical protein
MLAAGKLFQRFLACQARRAVDGGLSGDCFVRALRFRASFDKAESLGGCAAPGDIDSVGTLLKSAIDEMVFAQLQETCALLGNMNATTMCVQNPHVPECPGLMGCVKEHVDRERSPFDFCACL